MEREPIKPISPKEVVGKKETIIPNEVIEAFNELIAQNFNEGHAKVLQKDAEELMIKKGLDRLITVERGDQKVIDKHIIYEKHWMDVESIYRKAGWKVEYDQPSYGDSINFEPYFIFSRSRKSIRSGPGPY